jgi:hypothetical protein
MEVVKSKSNQLGFVEKALESLDTALAYAEGMVRTGVLPKHYYDANGKPKEGSTQSCLLVIQMGREVGMSNLQAIQQIVPVGNLLSIKGDGAKALIMSSGLVEFWKEEEIGQNDNFGFKITAKRRDTQEEKSTTFTIADAKRAGLWVTDEMVNKNQSLKYGAWFKYPKRMLRYRALGFISRDLFSDVLQGMVTLEEAEDYGKESTKVEVQTAAGQSITTNGDTATQEKMEVAAEKATAKTRAAVSKPKEESKPIEKVQEPEVVETKVNAPSPKQEVPAQSDFAQKLEALEEKDLNAFVKDNKNDVIALLDSEFKKQGFKDMADFFAATKTGTVTLRIAGIALWYLRPQGKGYKQFCMDHFSEVVHPALPPIVIKDPEPVQEEGSGKFLIPPAPRDFDQSGYVLEVIVGQGKDSAQGEEFATQNGFKDFEDFLANANEAQIERFLTQ